MKILLVDDDKNIRQTLSVSLRTLGHAVTAATGADAALRELRDGDFDFLLTDFRLGQSGEGENGVEILNHLRTLEAPPVAVLMTAYASFENAVNAVKAGAYDYLPKPFTIAQLEHVLRRVEELVSLRRENLRLKNAASSLDYFAGQTSPAMARLEALVRKLAPTDAGVLLTGESGTGKTALARLIHALSPRSSGPFVVVDCATLSESLLESELFGHAKGAFTGAVQDHVGKLEAAGRGTVLIDEVGELSASGQTRLLRFLQEKVIERIGSNREVTVDARVIAATNRDLEAAVRDGKFREDLYYRLNVFECNLVPLRYRREDLPVLIRRLLAEAASRSGVAPREVPAPTMRRLLEHAWPGNVRELRNAIERWTLVGDLPKALESDGAGPPAVTPLATLDAVERTHIEGVLKRESNQERAAAILGITTVTLWRKRKQYGLA
jgi:DNA-binding NtrC family response regulator